MFLYYKKCSYINIRNKKITFLKKCSYIQPCEDRMLGERGLVYASLNLNVESLKEHFDSEKTRLFTFNFNII